MTLLIVSKLNHKLYTHKKRKLLRKTQCKTVCGNAHQLLQDPFSSRLQFVVIVGMLSHNFTGRWSFENELVLAP